MQTSPLNWTLARTGSVSVAALLFAAVGCDSGRDCERTLSCPPGSSGWVGGNGGGQARGQAGSSAGAAGALGGGLGNSGMGAKPGLGGAGGQGSGCDTSRSPSESSCLVEDELGVFVSPDGNDSTGAGTKARPFRSLAKALSQTSTSKPRVFACGKDGTTADYSESLSPTSLPSGLSLWGGFDCSAWTYSTTRKAKLTAPAATLGSPGSAKPALSLEGVTALSLADFAITGPTTANPGESSVAVFVKHSSGVSFSRVSLTAKDAQKGADGVLTAYAFNTTAGYLDGTSGTQLLLGLGCNASGTSIQCPGPTGAITSPSKGGNGGGAGPDATTGLPGFNGKPTYSPPYPNGPTVPLGEDGLGNTVAECRGNAGGHIGAPGPQGADGGGAATPGTLGELGWSPQAGTDGEAGSVGQGGGGGASIDASGGGGGGACGGCGGRGASSGQGGGASIALLVLDSSVSLSEAALQSARAGDGGAGVTGQVGQAGGTKGAGAGNACSGGRGGKGGDGGASGGGAGGISAGILFKGAKPTYSPADTHLTPGTGGKAAPSPILSKPALKGTEGQAAPELQLG